jgi:hypothetical protein
MAILSRFHRIVGDKSGTTTQDVIEEPNTVQLRADDKEAAHVPVNEVVDDASEKDKPAEKAQEGVRKIEAVTLAWSRASMFTILVL